ncbi:hypothetical protein CSB45_02715 [candidate division KSB3 bacterium]|uniref:Type 4 fimbrial biogenesis protein PilX N-terminal domain-containing protein n=1 Tax=candidate division KSB3 bacterium TaxID=2044937 RepID=A0A2G6EA25_9BACT|nr:MAG: hypothetical protein CSB45_02715 [candidate division KSB3 bacterium]PIE30991.1 MAG: hypothetical protein CSA57_01330 [candidate division KSB3 bacterium]
MRKHERGSALLLVIMIVTVFLALLAFMLDRGTSLFQSIHHSSQEEVALNLAEAGLDFAVHKIMTSKGDFSGEEDVVLSTGRFATTITRLNSSGTIEIYSRGMSASPQQHDAVQRTLRMLISFDKESPEAVPVMYSREELL